MAEKRVHPQAVKEEERRESEGSRNINNIITTNNSSSNSSGSGSGRKESKEATKGQKTQSRAPTDSSSTGADKKKRATALSQQSAGTQPDGEGVGRQEQKTIEQQTTLREQLEKLVSQKLTNSGGLLDHAGLLALQTLSKLPAGPGVERSAAVAPAAAAGGAGAGLPRSRSSLPPGIESLPKFSGKDPSQLTDILNRFHSLVIAALPGASPAQQNKALNRDVVFVLEGSALKFFNALKAGQIDWEPIPPAPESQEGPEQQQQQQQAGKPPFRPPATWSEVYEAFHDHYLPADGIARTSETLFSLSQAAGETVPSLAQRQLGLTHHLNRLIEAHGGQTTFWEAITIRLFERALRADLRRLQHAEPPCLTFQESVDRAERNASSLQNTAKQSKGATNGRRREGHTGDGVAHANGTFNNNGAVHSKIKSEEEPRPSTHARDSPPADKPNGPAAVFPTRRDNTIAPEGNDLNGTAVRWKARPYPREASSTGKGAPLPTAHGDFLPQHAEDPDDNLDGGGSSHEGARFASAWEEPPDVRESGGRARGGGDEVGQDRPAMGKRHNHNKTPRGGQKRMRDWGDDEHADDGQHHHQPFSPHHRSWLVNPDSVPPCRVQECKSINRQFHCSDDCYFHPDHGQRNRRKAQRKRRIHPALQNQMPDPSERIQNGFEHQAPARFNGGNFDGNHLH